MNNHTPTPWSLCGEERGVCSCLQIWTTEHPIATVTGGKWGDEWPRLRLEGHAVPYMDMCEYGEISMDLAKANALHIVRCVNSHDALVEALRDALRLLQADEDEAAETPPSIYSDIVRRAYAALAKADAT